jgi:hypothetical protein
MSLRLTALAVGKKDAGQERSVMASVAVRQSSQAGATAAPAAVTPAILYIQIVHTVSKPTEWQKERVEKKV